VIEDVALVKGNEIVLGVDSRANTILNQEDLNENVRKASVGSLFSISVRGNQPG